MDAALRERCSVLERDNHALIQKVTGYERRIAELETFQANHRNAWGALNADEVLILARAEKTLLERDPIAFMQKNHEAVFCRERMEEQRKEFVEKLGAIDQQGALSQSPGYEKEIELLRRRLADQKNQMALQDQRIEELEQDLAVVQYHLKTSNLLWMRTGEEMEALQRSMAELTDENRQLRSDLAATVVPVGFQAFSRPTEPELVCTRLDLDSVVTSLYGQINELKGGRKQ